MDESLRSQVENYLSHLDGLIRRGREIHESLISDVTGRPAINHLRVWQQDCGILINQLSGGSKAHWLARSFSEAFLMRTAGQAVEGATVDEIVRRLINVLEQAVASLTGTDDGAIASASSQAPAAHRFDFVHNLPLRPFLEQAYTDSRSALEQGEYDVALRTSCGILEAIVTDALEHKGVSSLAASDAPAGKIADWSFETRLGLAEKLGLIRGGCARLPAVARKYRDIMDAEHESGSTATITERDARTTGQVLKVVMRDLDPGR